jgi:hypothetical protein
MYNTFYNQHETESPGVNLGTSLTHNVRNLSACIMVNLILLSDAVFRVAKCLAAVLGICRLYSVTVGM